MHKIKVTFSDGSTAVFHEEQTFMAIGFFEEDHDPKKYYASQYGTYGLWNHIHDGLIPSFMELLANAKFFYDVESPNTYYNSQSIVKVEKS